MRSIDLKFLVLLREFERALKAIKFEIVINAQSINQWVARVAVGGVRVGRRQAVGNGTDYKRLSLFELNRFYLLN